MLHVSTVAVKTAEFLGIFQPTTANTHCLPITAKFWSMVWRTTAIARSHGKMMARGKENGQRVCNEQPSCLAVELERKWLPGVWVCELELELDQQVKKRRITKLKFFW